LVENKIFCISEISTRYFLRKKKMWTTSQIFSWNVKRKKQSTFCRVWWCLWPNIRFLPSTVTKKNVTKNILDGRKDEQTDRGKTVYPQYMLIFRRIFLSNYWWQKSDIWSQASYRYPISWEVFFDPSDSYFLFAEEWGYHRWALAHS
jgi:hypothetical protein